MEGNQKTKTAQLTLVVKPKQVIKNPFINSGDYEVIIAPKYTLKTKTETDIKTRSVIGIKTPLDIMSIALQNKKERNQESSSKQMASATPLLI